ncbi:hypothetical protein CRYUN_Cryun28dG0064800 [Craigia yunnanensis]
MASFPSFSGIGTLKLEPDSRKHSTASLPSEKSPSISYPRTHTFAQSDGKSESVRNSFPGAQKLHSHIIKTGIHQDLFVLTFLVNVYAKCGAMENAQKVFISLPRKNVVAWTTLMTGYVHSDQPDVAITVFQEMLEFGPYPTNYTLGIAFNACSALNSLELGRQIHTYIIKYQTEHDTSVVNSLCSLYSKCASLDSAIKAFQKIGEKNVISWTTVISACGNNSRAAKGLRFFTEMLADNVGPNEFTLTSVLSMCCKVLSLSAGAQIHCLSIKLGYESNLRIKNSIMYLYLKCGWFSEAQQLFNGMEDMSLVTMNSMTAGYGEMMELALDELSAYHNGTEALNIFSKLSNSSFKPDLYTFSSILTVCEWTDSEALQLLEDMRLIGVRPNQITFVGVLLACGHAGMVDEALGYFEMMQKDYKIRPVMDHYACLIDIFVRLGLLDEAFDLIKKMDFPPNEFIWSLLLAGCKRHGNTELGFYAAEKLLELKPKDAETFVLLLNLYKSAERWEDVTKDKVYSFKPNERLAYGAEIYEFLDELVDKAKSLLGYGSLESFDLLDENDEEKTFSSTVQQSEKLAAAFGLLKLNIPDNAPIRIIKNISMCRGCHNFMKAISSLNAREIIIRDSKRHHKYVNGQCSCGDYGGLL